MLLWKGNKEVGDYMLVRFNNSVSFFWTEQKRTRAELCL